MSDEKLEEKLEWEKECERCFIALMESKRGKEYIKQQRHQLLTKINKKAIILISEEINIANQENQFTSRLTSFYNKFDNFLDKLGKE